MTSGKICMNGLCGTTTTSQWKRGWPMRLGGSANLCFDCGIAYDNVRYCERFHLNEPGWRECKFCDKPVHCGCVVSKYHYECLDPGGIACIKCTRAKEILPFKQTTVSEIPNGFTPFSGTWLPSIFTNRMNNSTNFDSGKLNPLIERVEKSQHAFLTPSVGQLRQDEHTPSSKEFGARCSSSKDINSSFRNFPHQLPLAITPDNNKLDSGSKSIYEHLLQQSVRFTLGSSGYSVVSTSNNGVVEGREKEKVPSFKQEQKPHKMVPKPLKYGASIYPHTNKGTGSENRLSRPPAEGRGRTPVLARYWPKITDQELLQISGELNSNCTLTPLFEKVMSASDAGRIGRLVLPKACAEAYFPLIDQSEGVPIKVRDIKGKEWTFQFRFWPNNNSRMYVLEGVTPCIQSLQLQAGDTVIFSRLDPEDKLVIGCRKATFSAETSPLPNPIINIARYCTENGNQPTNMEHEGTGNCDSFPLPNPIINIARYCTENGNQPTNMEHEGTGNCDSFPLPNPIINIARYCTENGNQPTNMEHEGTGNCDSLQQPAIQEKKKMRNIGSKSKRLHMNSEEAMELKFTWEEAQDFLRPPPSKPTVFVIEDCELEEYDEPPVFGKMTIFTTNASRLQEQWVQCDSCSKWRKLSSDVLIPAKWTCSDNVTDPDRCSCSSPEEKGVDELDRILKFGNESKKRKIIENRVTEKQPPQPTDLNALVNVEVLGDKASEATTRHPRHRPGCSCIVCIQPPSGKAKHKPTCTCTVCSTVKRRFNTLMLRKKKRLDEKESKLVKSQVPVVNKTESINIGQELDLNCDPTEEQTMLLEAANASNIPPVWQNVLEGLVSNDTSNIN